MILRMQILILGFPDSEHLNHIIFPAGGQCPRQKAPEMIDRSGLFIYNIVCIHLQEERELK